MSTPEPGPTDALPSRGNRTRVRISLIAATAALLLLGGYSTWVGLAELPELTPTLTVEATETQVIDDDAAQQLVDAQSGPTAIGFAGTQAVWSNDDAVYSIASLTKLVTVLVAQAHRPLEPWSDGETYVWTAEDAAEQQRIAEQLGAVIPLEIGTEMTERQMLTMILLQSANNVAVAYSDWVFGSNEAFVQAVDQFASEQSLDTLTIVEPTGLDPANQSNAADMVRVGRLAVADPTIVEITSMSTAQLPWGVGTITNTNPLLDTVSGVVGLKTGSLNGYSLLLARVQTFDDQDLTQLAVVLERPSRADRQASGEQVLGAMSALPRTVVLFEEDAQAGSVRTWQHDVVPVVAAETLDTVVVGGEQLTRTIDVSPVGISPAGQVVAQASFSTESTIGEVDFITTQPITEPGFWWRFTHPLEISGLTPLSQ